MCIRDRIFNSIRTHFYSNCIFDGVTCGSIVFNKALFNQLILCHNSVSKIFALMALLHSVCGMTSFTLGLRFKRVVLILWRYHSTTLCHSCVAYGSTSTALKKGLYLLAIYQQNNKKTQRVFHYPEFEMNFDKSSSTYSGLRKARAALILIWNRAWFLSNRW